MSVRYSVLGRVLLAYVDRLNDVCSDDPLDKIVAELLADVDYLTWEGPPGENTVRLAPSARVLRIMDEALAAR